MDRNIPHVMDIFTSSPGERRRRREREVDKISSQLKEQQKNPGSDSAVSLDSSDDDERNISKYFDYLDDDTAEDTSKKNVISVKGKENRHYKGERESRKFEYENEIIHIERHLSMKKTIRKKMMRDLRQALVENPGELQQDPANLTKDKKRYIDIHNLTISRKRMSKSEHSFLDMLKDEDCKVIKNDQNKSKSSGISQDDIKIQPKSRQQPQKKFESNPDYEDDSGNESPTREKCRNVKKNVTLSKTTNKKITKEVKKISFWKRLTGKGGKAK